MVFVAFPLLAPVLPVGKTRLVVVAAQGAPLARHFPRVSFRSSQRITPPLTLTDVQRFQRVGLCVLQRGHGTLHTDFQFA